MRLLPASAPSWRVLLAVSVALTVITVGVAGAVLIGTSSEESQPPATQRWEYVALGDSYTAAPYNPPQSLDDPCFRSGANYPALLSEAIPELELTDVSCGGATTDNMTAPQVLGADELPAQFDALDTDTDLVTIGIGGNDSSLFSALIYACFPGTRSGVNCHAGSPRGAELQALFDQIRLNVVEVLDGIAERSPDAEIVVVTYPQFIGASSSCPDLFPFDASDTAYIADVSQRLSGALMDAADEAGATYVDVLAASQGHDICATEPWIQGGDTDVSVAASFHPLPAEQQAVADLLRERLCSDELIC